MFEVKGSSGWKQHSGFGIIHSESDLQETTNNRKSDRLTNAALGDVKNKNSTTGQMYTIQHSTHLSKHLLLVKHPSFQFVNLTHSISLYCSDLKMLQEDSESNVIYSD